MNIALSINYADSLKNSSHKSKSQFCKVGEYTRHGHVPKMPLFRFPITGIVAHNRRRYGRLSHITEARSAWRPDRRCAQREKLLLTKGYRLLSELSYCRHNSRNR